MSFSSSLLNDELIIFNLLINVSGFIDFIVILSLVHNFFNIDKKLGNNLLLLLISSFNSGILVIFFPERKNWTKGVVFIKHCKVEFIYEFLPFVLSKPSVGNFMIFFILNSSF